MMNFSNIRISVKLGGAFLVMVLLTGAIGGFALMQLARLNANTEEMATTEEMNGHNAQGADLAHSNAKETYAGSQWSVIDGIAFQTNILALKAAVEAAPAGGDDDWETF